MASQQQVVGRHRVGRPKGSSIKSEVHRARERLEHALTCANHVLLGKEQVVRLALTCMIARGHLLIDDIPGVGKTILAHLLAKLFGLDFKRVQFTSDLLPADILGSSIYSRGTESFRFHPGPVFSQVMLADEVNRATPKAQSALLEAMEEGQVTVEGTARELPRPFFVIATQNPTSQIGTYPLPESQVDRFMMRLELGYPGSEAERELLLGTDRRRMLETLTPVAQADYLLHLQALLEQIHAGAALLDYLQHLLTFSRESGHYSSGLSPRAGLAMLACGRAWALLHGREYVLPEDVQAVLPSAIGHRLRLRGGQSREGSDTGEQVAELIAAVPVP